MLNNSKIIAWYVATQSEIAKFEQFRTYSMNIEAMSAINFNLPN